MDKIIAKNVNISLDRFPVLKDVNLNIQANKITAVIGPNGSGKSTLLKVLSGLIKTKQGEVFIDNQPISIFSRKELAKKVSFLMQNPEAPENITVKELVSLGRFSYQTWRGLTAKDHARINFCIRQVDLENKKDEPLSKLSGGQRRRAWIAMALAQDSDILLLDEPTAFLDIRHQLEILCILKKLQQEFSKTIVVVLHDIQQVIKFADDLIIINEGKIAYHEPINANIDVSVIEKVFGIEVKIFNNDHMSFSMHEKSEELC